MIILGCYPKSINIENKRSALQNTNDLIDKIVPSDIAVHLLPFYPSSGDFGFAPDNLHEVDPKLGNWQDVKAICAKRRCIFDGIYNHVGIQHDWIKNFSANPELVAGTIHAYRFDEFPECPSSPRGQPVLQLADENLSNWYFWKTFTSAAVDIRIESPNVQDYIDDHLNLLKQVGVWGVRLDAVAYYKNSYEKNVRHNKEAYRLAETIAEKVSKAGFKVFAQLNRDSEGLEYYSDPDFSDIGINDFTYAIFLILAILREEPSALVRYDASCTDQRTVIRAPRNHDGLLLRSKSLSDEDRSEIIDRITDFDTPLRIENGTPYELNCSLPYLLRSAFPQNFYETLELMLVVTCMSSGVAYLYLPALTGFIPEDYRTDLQMGADPRGLNRAPITAQHLSMIEENGWLGRISEVLSKLAHVRKSVQTTISSRFKTEMSVHENGLLNIETEKGKFVLLANFSSKQMSVPDKFRKFEIISKRNSDQNFIGPKGYRLFANRGMLE